MTLRVSDHAVLRFIERSLGLDVEGIREGMRESAQRGYDAVERIGGGEHAICFGHIVFLIRDDTVCTVVDRKSGRTGR